MCKIARAIKPYKLIAFALALCFGIVSTLCVAFASPELTDSDITFSVKGSLAQYWASTPYERGFIDSNGNIVLQSGGSYVSDFVACSDLTGYYFFTGVNSSISSILSYILYDANKAIVSVHYNARVQSFIIPEGVSFIRFCHTSGNGVAQKYTFSYSEPSSFIYHTFDSISISAVGDITIPYQVNAYNAVLLDFTFFDSVRTFNNISFRSYITYTGGYFSGSREWSGTDSGGIHLYSFYFANNDTSDPRYFDLASTTSNPFVWNCDVTSSVFSGFRLEIPFLSVSTSLNIQLTDFQLDGEDVSARLEIDRALDQLNDLANQLAVPTPQIDVDNILVNAFEGTDMNNTHNFFAVFYNNDIVPKMLIIAVSIALLGYILFGKKEA